MGTVVTSRAQVGISCIITTILAWGAGGTCSVRLDSILRGCVDFLPLFFCRGFLGQTRLYRTYLPISQCWHHRRVRVKLTPLTPPKVDGFRSGVKIAAGEINGEKFRAFSQACTQSICAETAPLSTQAGPLVAISKTKTASVPLIPTERMMILPECLKIHVVRAINGGTNTNFLWCPQPPSVRSVCSHPYE